MHFRLPVFFKKHILYCFTAIPMVIAMVVENRSFTLGYLAATAFVFLVYRNFRVSKRIIAIILTVFTVALFFVTWFVKQDSSLGRWLIYKVSMNIWMENGYKGIGYNQFEKVYNLYQETYFKKGDYSGKELLLADDTYYAFNDYFQLAIELGITGFVILLLAMAVVFCLIVLNYKSSGINQLQTTVVVSQMIAICTAAVFTHIFERPIFQYIILLGIVYLFVNCQRWAIRQKKTTTLVAVMVVVLFGIFRYMHLEKSSQLKEWARAQHLYNAGEITDALNLYQKCDLALRNNPAFLTSYGIALRETGQYQGALHVFRQAFERLPSSKRLIYMAECFLGLGDSSRAREYYIRAINMVPNRFNPRYQLFNLYVSSGCRNRAISLGNEILSLPVKIPSPRVEFIKKDVLNRVQQISIF